jgi:integrase
MAEVAAKERGEPVEIAPWGFHDLRRTAATGLARLGIGVQVTEAVLNHVSGSRAGVAGVYQRHDFAREARVALDGWAALVVGLSAEAPANVVALEAER